MPPPPPPPSLPIGIIIAEPASHVCLPHFTFLVSHWHMIITITLCPPVPGNYNNDQISLEHEN